MKDKYEELKEALNKGNLYDYISDNGLQFTKEELISIIKNLDYAIYDYSSNLCPDLEKKLIDYLDDYDFFGEDEKVLKIKCFTLNKKVIEAIKKRADEKVWYVLKYDEKTTEYNNEIVFKTFKEANEEWENTIPSYDEEHIELIFAPESDDPEFGDNILVKTKKLD